MTDNDIIKALERCICKDNNALDCKSCPYNRMVGSLCIDRTQEDALELINRQKAEIERLENDLEEMADRLSVLLWHATNGKLSKSNYTKEAMICAVDDCIDDYCRDAEAEAIKEFRGKLWKKLCTRVTPSFVFDFIRFVEEEMEKEMKEEMVGEME